MSVAIRTSQHVVLEYEPASIGDRILATLIDYIVFLGWFMLTLGVPSSLHVPTGGYYVVLVVLLPIALYDLLCEWLLNGRSVGKLAVDTRVVMLDGSQPGLGAYLIRWLFRLVESVVFFGGVVAVITVAANGKGQRLGDIAAGTTVVKAKASGLLSDILAPPLPDTYRVQFPDVSLLSDRDITIVRDVLQRGDDYVLMRTDDKIKEVTGILSNLEARTFLEMVIDDYQFIMSQ
ncbi:MAG: hypothetical protein JWP57_2693 [Spirosoma sp.]|nr:hypothetical protein [Spirosoma sp.]